MACCDCREPGAESAPFPSKPGRCRCIVSQSAHRTDKGCAAALGQMVRLVRLPELRARLYDQTLMPIGDNAESFADTLKRDMALWQQNATAAGIKPQ